MTPSTRPAARRGNALMLVVVFLVVMLSMIGETFRQAATTLRVESARSKRVACDEGSMEAAAWAVKWLEDGNTPIDSAPYSHLAYQVVFTGEPSVAGDPSGSKRWAIQITPAP